MKLVDCTNATRLKKERDRDVYAKNASTRIETKIEARPETEGKKMGLTVLKKARR